MSDKKPTDITGPGEETTLFSDPKNFRSDALMMMSSVLKGRWVDITPDRKRIIVDAAFRALDISLAAGSARDIARICQCITNMVGQQQLDEHLAVKTTIANSGLNNETIRLVVDKP